MDSIQNRKHSSGMVGGHMKKIIAILIFLIVIPAILSAEMITYGLVQDGSIIKYRRIDGTDALLVGKMTAHGYLPVRRVDVAYDAATEVLDSYIRAISGNEIVETPQKRKKTDGELIRERISQLMEAQGETLRNQAIAELRSEGVIE